MSAQPHCTGAVHVYASAGSGGALYIGTGERAPRRRIVRHWSPCMNDLGGSAVPFDIVYQGREAFVFVRLTRFHYANLLKIYDPFGEAKGEDDQEEIGTLMMTEGRIGELWLTYPYNERMPGMPTGYHFHAAVLETDEEQPGTEAEYVDLSWHCYRKYVNGKFQLYDHEIAGANLPAAE